MLAPVSAGAAEAALPRKQERVQGTRTHALVGKVEIVRFSPQLEPRHGSHQLHAAAAAAAAARRAGFGLRAHGGRQSIGLATHSGPPCGAAGLAANAPLSQS